jgi:hypothetical protein
MVQPLLGRTAFAVLHFLELLVGPRCQLLAVEKPEVKPWGGGAIETVCACRGERDRGWCILRAAWRPMLTRCCVPGPALLPARLQRYNFDVPQLLVTLVQLAGQLGQHDAFLQVACVWCAPRVPRALACLGGCACASHLSARLRAMRAAVRAPSPHPTLPPAACAAGPG